MNAPSPPTPTADPRPSVRLEGAGKRFGRQWVLAHLDLEIGSGESMLLAGANGSGKTTLLRLICGLLRPSRGLVEVYGVNASERPFDVRPRLSLVSHRTFLYDQLSAAEHVRLWSRLCDGDARALSENDWLAQVDLADRREDLVATFSAGMRKRLSLLRTRIEDPDLVLLDEPFSALDPSGQAMVAGWLQELAAQGKTLVIASHALERASALCDSAVVLERGQIVWRGDPATLGRDGLPTDRRPGAEGTATAERARTDESSTAATGRES